MDEIERTAILDRAYAALDEADALDARLREREATRDPSAPDALEEWQRLRDRSREPEPKPRHLSDDTAAVRAHWEAGWCEFVDRRADARIAAAFGRDAADGAAWAQGGLLRHVFASVIATERRRVRRELEAEIGALRRELDDARAEIKSLRKRGAAPTIISWQFDKKHYRAIPTMTDGKPGAPLDLRPFFEMYQWETT